MKHRGDQFGAHAELTGDTGEAGPHLEAISPAAAGVNDEFNPILYSFSCIISMFRLIRVGGLFLEHRDGGRHAAQSEFLPSRYYFFVSGLGQFSAF
jgi:hypothetical protein